MKTSKLLLFLKKKVFWRLAIALSMSAARGRAIKKCACVLSVPAASTCIHTAQTVPMQVDVQATQTASAIFVVDVS